jgi:hypothetical protein
MLEARTQPQSNIGGHLIVARTGRVKFPADRLSNVMDETRLDSHVNVFKLGTRDVGALGQFGLDEAQAFKDAVPTFGVDQASV